MNTLTALRHAQALVEQEAVVLTFLDDANETNTKACEVIAALIEELEAAQ